MVKEQREKIQNGQKGDKRFEGKGGARLSSGSIQVGRV